MWTIDDIESMSVWVHKDKSTFYQIIVVTNLTATNRDFVPQVVYQSFDGEVYSRPVEKFLERMIKVDPTKLFTET